MSATAPRIITRAEWGFDGWRDGLAPHTVNEQAARDEFFIHYNGPATGGRNGVSVPRSVHAFHKNGRGWAGIGYGHLVTQDGTIYEGRGFGYVGAHCPDHNYRGYSAQGYIGQGETPSPAMLRSLRYLYDLACKRSGRTLAKKGHRDGRSTECPGDTLYTWVRKGMPAAQVLTPPPPRPSSVLPPGSVRVADIRPGKRNDSCLRFNAALWREMNKAYKAKHSAAWFKEPADTFGPVAEAVMIDLYEWLHDTKGWPAAPSRPAWPGKGLVEYLGLRAI